MHNVKGEAGQKVGQYYAVGLQDFTPKEGYYDLIWCQWVLSHLTDGTVVKFVEFETVYNISPSPPLLPTLPLSSPLTLLFLLLPLLPLLPQDDFVSFLHRCVKGLNPRGGMIFVKENIASERDEFDEVDSSVTRCVDSLLNLFEKVGLDVLDQKDQEKFPQQLFKVTM